MTIEELDATVRGFYEGRGDQQKQAQSTLNQFKENPDAWLMVDKILQEAQYPQTKYLGLQVLDNVIMTRWKVLPRAQCQGIRNFVVNFIIEMSRKEDLQGGEDVAEQAESSAGVGPQAGVAAQLAYIHQRDHLELPDESAHLREQHGHPAVAVGRGLRLLRRSDDFDQDQEAQAEHV